MTKNDNTIRERIIKGLELTHKRLIEVKKQRNLDLIVSDNGRVIHINPRDL
jgi:indole-3-glycerol phosphate synthase